MTKMKPTNNYKYNNHNKVLINLNFTSVALKTIYYLIYTCDCLLVGSTDLYLHGAINKNNLKKNLVNKKINVSVLVLQFTTDLSQFRPINVGLID